MNKRTSLTQPARTPKNKIMGAKKHTLYSTCCKVELNKEYEDYCPKCKAPVSEPLEEPDLLQDEEIYYFD